MNRVAVLVAAFAVVPPLSAPHAQGSPMPAPSPSASLRQIGHVRTSAFCAALHGEVRDVFFSSMGSDTLIAYGRRLFARMAQDTVTKSGPDPVARNELQKITTALTKNLAGVDKALADPTKFRTAANSADENELLALKTKLEAVRDDQTEALNLLQGTTETQALSDMQVLPSEIQRSVDAPTGPATPLSGFDTAGISGLGVFPNDVVRQQVLAAESSTLPGHTIYDLMGRTLDGTRAQIARHEDALSGAILSAEDSCRQK